MLKNIPKRPPKKPKKNFFQEGGQKIQDTWIEETVAESALQHSTVCGMKKNQEIVAGIATLSHCSKNQCSTPKLIYQRFFTWFHMYIPRLSDPESLRNIWWGKLGEPDTNLCYINPQINQSMMCVVFWKIIWIFLLLKLKSTPWWICGLCSNQILHY